MTGGQRGIKISTDSKQGACIKLSKEYGNYCYKKPF